MSNLEIGFYALCTFILIFYGSIFVLPLIQALRDYKDEEIADE